MRRTIRRAVAPVQQLVDEWQMQRAVAALRKSQTPDMHALHALREAWGNTAWSADLSFLLAIAERVPTCQGPILDCGSGATTLIAAIVAERKGLSVIALEQDAQWVEHVQSAFKGLDIRNADIRYAPLRPYDEYAWYDVKVADLPKHFGLVPCDGPALFKEKLGALQEPGRYGLLPIFRDHGITIDEILYDDVDDPRGMALLHNWERDFDITCDIVRAPDGAFASIKI